MESNDLEKNNNNGNGHRWEKTYISIIGALFGISVILVGFLANQLFEENNASKAEIRALKSELAQLKIETQYQLNQVNIALTKIDSRLEIVLERSARR